MGDQRVGIRDDFHVSVLLPVKRIFQIRETIEIPVHSKDFFERYDILIDVSDLVRHDIDVIFALDIYIAEIELRQIRKEIGIGEESKIVLRLDAYIDHLIESRLDEAGCGVCCESAQDLLDLEIISCLIIKIISGRDDTASIVEKLRFARDDLRLGELLYVFDALELIHFLHAVELAEMLIDDRSYEIDEFFLVPDEFRIDEDIVHSDIVRKLDMLVCLIISEDVPSFRLERSLAYMLLVEERIIIIVPHHLEKE